MIRLRNAALAASIFLALGAREASAVESPAPQSQQSSGSPVAQAAPPMPANVAQLDKALADKDYIALNQVHDAIRTGSDLLLLMNWEQVRVFDGGGIYVTLLYMTDLWKLA